jgi:hypothetical protein
MTVRIHNPRNHRPPAKFNNPRPRPNQPPNRHNPPIPTGHSLGNPAGGIQSSNLPAAQDGIGE